MKTKALISFAVTAKLICVFVFAHAKSRFSHDGAHLLSVQLYHYFHDYGDVHIMIIILFQSLSTGADSNGSGVIALLELSRLFSKLFTNSRTHAKYNLVFLLTGAGKYNYLGAKKWIEDSLDASGQVLSVLPICKYALRIQLT